jgi:hypothetical protein
MLTFFFHTFNVRGFCDGNDDSRKWFPTHYLGRSCAFKSALLDSKGIDIDKNQHLILQGEVKMAL